MTKPLLAPPSNSKAQINAFAPPAHRESHDDYARVIVKCRKNWRVIIDKAGSQYITQKRSSSTNTGVWIGKSYCTTKSELLRVCSRLELLSDANAEAVLMTLPEFANDYFKT